MSSLYKALRRHMPDFDDYRLRSPTAHLTKEQEEQICRVYERTGIQTATSRITGHSVHTVRRVLEEADLLGGLPGPDRQDPSKWKLASLYFDQLPEIWWVADDTYEGYSPEMIEHRRGIAPEDQTRLLNDYSRALRLPIPQAA